MGDKMLVVGCDGGENCGDNDAQLDRINIFYDGASSGKYWRDRRRARIAARRALPPGQPLERKRGRGQQLGKCPQNKGWTRPILNPLVVERIL
jgi:hypothetical protein